MVEATATKWDKMDGAYSVQTDTSLPMGTADQSTSSAALTIRLTVSVQAATMDIHCQEDHVSVTKAEEEGDGDLGTEDHTHINHSKGLPATNSNPSKAKAIITLMDSHSPTNDHYLFYYYITTLLHYTILHYIANNYNYSQYIYYF